MEMGHLRKYNTKLGIRINRIMRTVRNRSMRKKLLNHDFSLLCNNCTGGIITHDLGLQFRSPTINLFFYNDHFFKFCENFDYYISQPLTLCDEPIHKQKTEYPVCNLGDLELHFLHYKSFEQAKQKWDSRAARINKENIFVMWTFLGGTDEELLARFDAIPFRNKVAFTEKEFPQYKSAFYIRGYEENGITILTWFDNLLGRRVVDQFDYVKWFNEGK